MPFDLDPIYLFYLFVALAAVLFVEGGLSAVLHRASYRKSINRRLDL